VTVVNGMVFAPGFQVPYKGPLQLAVVREFLLGLEAPMNSSCPRRHTISSTLRSVWDRLSNQYVTVECIDERDRKRMITKSIVSRVLRCTGVGVRPIRMVRSTLDTIR
jgi:hypothetical protein